jgi:CDP-diglyceride synthetase
MLRIFIVSLIIQCIWGFLPHSCNLKKLRSPVLISPRMSKDPPDLSPKPISINQVQPSGDRIILGMGSKLRKRWITGLSLGAIATLWIFSGSGYFTLGFLLTSIIWQMEYYTMVQKTGVEPAIKTGLFSSFMCFLVAAICPQYHEFVMPLSATQLMLWLLIFNKKAASINEISSTFLGIFFMGYMPSFWVRLRALGEISPTLFPLILKQWGWTRADTWTQGAVVTWWTWTSTVFADVGAYFIGKKYGKHKLSSISSAAGSASPNKTVEGALAGFVSCTALSLLGAWLMQWPHWQVTGTVYGLLISFVALIGDLTASMMKRDAKMKDSGTLLPGHGGLLDRFDSYMFTAPVAYLFCTLILPFAKRIKLENIKLVISI